MSLEIKIRRATPKALNWSVFDSETHVGGGYGASREDAAHDAAMIAASHAVKKALPQVRFQPFTWSPHVGTGGGWAAESLCGEFEAVCHPVGADRWAFWILLSRDGGTVHHQNIPVL